MITRVPKYSMEEHARMGTELYETKIRPQVEAGNYGKVVAMDVDTGDYEVDRDALAATTRLLDRLPDAQVWAVRIGYPGVYRFGVRAPK